MDSPPSSAARLLKTLAVGFLLLLVNSSYLAAYGTPSAFYIANLLLHLGLGLLLAALFLVFLLGRWSSLSAGARASALLLLLSAAFGVSLMLIAGGPTRPPRWVVQAHILA